MKYQTASLFLLAAAIGGASGCGGGATAQPEGPAASSIDGARFLLSEEPEGAVGVIAAKESAGDGEPLVLVGRIGGAANPWVEGRAAFTLIDASMMVVAEGEDSEEGELCTGDCCATERQGCTTLVKFLDDAGSVAEVDSRQLLGVKEGDMVVVHGVAKKDDSGNFTMLGAGLYVRK